MTIETAVFTFCVMQPPLILSLPLKSLLSIQVAALTNLPCWSTAASACR